MRSDPDAQPDGSDSDADGQESVARSGLWARARNSLRVPGVLVRLARRDPHHIPERLTIYTVDRHADEARVWARRARDAAPESTPAVLADGQRRRATSTARIDGAVAGTPFFIALVPAYIAFLRRRCGFTCVWRRSTGTTRPTLGSPPTSSSFAAFARTQSRPSPNSRPSAPRRFLLRVNVPR